MQIEIVFSGFGGQGVMFMGQLLTYAAMDAGKEVTWIPSYGPEMRGGTANCTVVISDEEIGSPVVRNPQAAVILNLPSLDKYEPLIQPDGVLIVNGSLVDREVERKDLDVTVVPAQEMAETLGNKRMLNMILLGVLLERLPVLSLEALEDALREHLPERHKRLLPKNLEALRQGMGFAKAQTVPHP